MICRAELDRRADEASKLEAANAASREELVQKKDKTGSMTRQIENDRREKARLQEEMVRLFKSRCMAL